jgi:hypothetical protein
VAVEYDSALYPEILEFGSLAGAANSVGAGFDPGAEFVRAESAMELIVTWIDDGCSRVSINIGARERVFILGFSRSGNSLAQGETADLGEAVAAAVAWLGGAALHELRATWSFVEFDELQEAYARGDEVETKWRIVLREAKGGWRDLMLSAYGRPELRSMFPIYSHGMFRVLHSSHVSKYDTPYIRAHGIGSYVLVDSIKGETVAQGDMLAVVEAYAQWAAGGEGT